MKLVISIVIVSLMAACGGGDYASETSAYDQEIEAPYSNELSLAKNSTELSDKVTSSRVAEPPPEPEPESEKPPKKDPKKIIKTAQVNIEVEKFGKARNDIETLLNKYDAYLFSEKTDNSAYRKATTIVAKMQPDNFHPFIEALEKIALNVNSRNIQAKDVTKQFVDIQSRLTTKRDVVQRYRSLLAKATKITDILEVEEKIRVLVEEIEAIEGQLRYLKDAVNYSTVTVYLYENIENPIIASVKKSFFTRLGNSLSIGWNGFLDLIIGLAVLWPFWLIVGTVSWLGLRRWRKKKVKA